MVGKTMSLFAAERTRGRDPGLGGRRGRTCTGRDVGADCGVAQGASANVGVVSDYVFRGVSQTNGDGALQGGADFGVFGGYVGAWASNVDFGFGNDTEVDIYAGFRPSLLGLMFDIGAIAYRYFGAPDDANLSFYELKAATSYTFGGVTLGAAVFWSPNFTGPGSNEATYYEANVAVPVYKNFTAGGAVGRQTVKGPGDYNTWNAGLTCMPAAWLAIDGRYHDTDEHTVGENTRIGSPSRQGNFHVLVAGN